jgi:hypothetical protein
MDRGAHAFNNLVDLLPIIGLIMAWIHNGNGNVEAAKRSFVFSSIITAIAFVSYVGYVRGGIIMAIFSGRGAFVISSVLTREMVWPSLLPSGPAREIPSEIPLIRLEYNGHNVLFRRRIAHDIKVIED